eukprot:Pompholyxophrys_punicea_v1_NODE_608_length_1601_cov_4.930834.p2 type:complete len:156 gc:universal NODE_608_length_1601_cov_4.930834:490-23(-)
MLEENDENSKKKREKNFARFKEIYERYDLKTLQDFSDFYLSCDVTQLTDIFENFRDLGMNTYGRDPWYDFTTPGYGWKCLLKLTGVQLELLTDQEMYEFFEKGIRGGMVNAVIKYMESNHPAMKEFNKDSPRREINYLDATNLYGWAMLCDLFKH